MTQTPETRFRFLVLYTAIEYMTQLTIELNSKWDGEISLLKQFKKGEEFEKEKDLLQQKLESLSVLISPLSKAIDSKIHSLSKVFDTAEEEAQSYQEGYEAGLEWIFPYEPFLVSAKSPDKKESPAYNLYLAKRAAWSKGFNKGWAEYVEVQDLLDKEYGKVK